MTNFLVKNFLERLMNGMWIFAKGTILSYPTIDIRTATVLPKAAAYTITQANLEAPVILTNTGASGTLAHTLPAVKKSAGKVLRVALTVAQIVRLTPQTGEAVNYNGSAVVSKYLNLAGVIGNFVEVFCDGTQWVVTSANGVVTKEA